MPSPQQFWSFIGSVRPATKHDLEQTEARLKDALNQIKKLMDMTQDELAAGLDAITEQQGKIAAEQAARSDTLQAEIKRLQDLLNQGGTIGDKVITAFNKVKTASQALDDSIPDPPTP